MSKIDKMLTPFFGLFAYIATRMYAGSEAAQLTRLKQEKPTYFALTLIGDALVRLVAVAAVLFLTVYAALKLVS